MTQNSPQQPERPQIMTRRQLRELRAAQQAQGQVPASPSQPVSASQPAQSASQEAQPEHFASRRQQREARQTSAASAPSALSAPAASAPVAPQTPITGAPPRVVIPRAATGVRSVDPHTGELSSVESTGQFPAFTDSSVPEAPPTASPERPSVSDILARAARQEAERTGQEVPESEPPVTRRSLRSAMSAPSATSVPSAYSAHSAPAAYSAPAPPSVPSADYEPATDVTNEPIAPSWASFGSGSATSAGASVPSALSAPSVASPILQEPEGDEVWPTQVPFPRSDVAPQASFEEILAADDEDDTDELDHRFDWKHWLMLMVAAAVIGVLVWMLVEGNSPGSSAAFGMTQYVETTFAGTPIQGELW